MNLKYSSVCLAHITAILMRLCIFSLKVYLCLCPLSLSHISDPWNLYVKIHKKIEDGVWLSLTDPSFCFLNLLNFVDYLHRYFLNSFCYLSKTNLAKPSKIYGGCQLCDFSSLTPNISILHLTQLSHFSLLWKLIVCLCTQTQQLFHNLIILMELSLSFVFKTC